MSSSLDFVDKMVASLPPVSDAAAPGDPEEGGGDFL